jgi:hypothetical protein
MDTQAAKEIAGAIGDIADLKLRLTALDRVLEQQQPSLYAAYQRELENLRNSKAHQMLQASLGSLQRRLESL